MSRTYRDWSPNQSSLSPPSPQDWLPEDDLVYFLLDSIATIDLAPLFVPYEREPRGQPPFHPRMMVARLLDCHAAGTRSSREAMRRCRTDVARRIIVGDDIPDFRAISDFRKTHLTQPEALFVEVLKPCASAGLTKVGTVAPDGTEVKAGASRREAMGYERMRQEERRLKEEVARLLAEAEAKAPPETAPADAVPKPKDQINFTDPESRIMPASNKGWDQCGNARAVADEARIIPAADVTDQADDKRQALPMMDQARENPGAAGVSQSIGAGLMGSGYSSEANAAELERRGIDPYVATERLRRDEEIPPVPRGRIPDGLTAEQRMARELRTKEGRGEYARREGIIEPIFGQVKQGLGFRQPSLRGPAAMRSEWRLMCAVHDQLKLWRPSCTAVAG